jgi:hypothetical protein
MKKSLCFASIVLLGGLLSACSTLFQPLPTSTPSAPPTQTPFTVKGIIHPGDKIGEMTITNEESKHYYWLYNCNVNWTLKKTSETIKCTMPEVPAIGIGPLWGAETAKFDASWEPITWELYVDDYQVALDEFGYFDLSYYDPNAGFDTTYRNWNVLLRNLSPGEHIIRFSDTITSEVNDGWDIYPPGKYELIVYLTVTNKPIYSTLPPVPEPGQHAYTSKSGDLDFLLYVPESYGVDSVKKWPIIIYLHDAEWRGSTDFLVIESLPKRLQIMKDFEFLVVSPVGNGEWDFWSKDEMIEPVMKLLDEIQSTYPVDAERIYLTGAGMGGNGVWAMGLRNPDYFAALAPLGGYIYPFDIPENICNLKDVPIWAFHGEEDFMVPPKVEQDLVDAVNTCGGTAKFTVKPGAVVPIDVYYNSELFDWLLAQSKK